MPDPSIQPVLGVSANAAEAGDEARVLMARHAGELWWLALMIEAINALSARVDALGPAVRGGCGAGPRWITQRLLDLGRPLTPPLH